MTAVRTQYLTLTVVLFLVGLLGSVAYRSTAAISSPATSEDRHAQLVALVEDLERQRADLEDELVDLRSQVAELERQHSSRSGVERSYTSELDRLTMRAGLRAVQGPGVQVTLADSPSPPLDEGEPGDYVIHDYDVRAVVNALWTGGAEALAVNGQRLVHSSAIRCVGATILVNNTRVGSPFVITAIGDEERLLAALETDVEARLLLTTFADRYDLQVDVEEGDDWLLPAYAGSFAPRELRAVPGDDGAALSGPDSTEGAG